MHRLEYVFDEVALFALGAATAGDVSGVATIHADDDGEWTIEAILVEAHERAYDRQTGTWHRCFAAVDRREHAELWRLVTAALMRDRADAIDEAVVDELERDGVRLPRVPVLAQPGGHGAHP